MLQAGVKIARVSICATSLSHSLSSKRYLNVQIAALEHILLVELMHAHHAPWARTLVSQEREIGAPVNHARQIRLRWF
jgi:hypothetical protein